MIAPRAETRAGPVSGRRERGIEVFLGIPYAGPAGGTLRFRAPSPVEAWREVRRCEAVAPSALQPAAAPPLLASLPGGTRSGVAGGEDCLALNVFTPAADGGRRPVLVWIHGGGFTGGSGGFLLYRGHRMARRGDVVVVTINYRLGALGGLDLATLTVDAEAEVNFALRDQVSALEWVRDNIAAFGGDPGRVTLFGQSAGAMSIGALLAVPRARGLFHRVILQSGAADNVHTGPEPGDLARRFAIEAGLDPERSRLVEDLRSLSPEAIVDAQVRAARRFKLPLGTLAWQPSVDGRFLPEPPLTSLEGGDAAGIPLLIGTNLDEWKLFTATDARRRNLSSASLRDYLLRTFELDGLDSQQSATAAAAALDLYQLEPGGGKRTPGEVWIAFQSDRIFRRPAERLAAALARRGTPVYHYRFDWRPRLFRKRLGAFHALEIPFVFGTLREPLLRPLLSLPPGAAALSDRIQGAWLAFARGGEPGGGALPSWPRYDSTRRATMIFGPSHCRCEELPWAAAHRFWATIDADARERSEG